MFVLRAEASFQNKIKIQSGYQVFLAKKKKEVKIVTRTTGLIKDLNHANKIASQNQADQFLWS